jgi:hypothetical protein
MTHVILLLATLASAVNADNFFVQAQYRTNKCDTASVNLFSSQPQSACVTSDGTNFSIWNCTSGDPVVYNCGKDATCQSCNSTGRGFKSADCLEYPVPGTYSGTWSKRFCATSLVPFPGVSFNLARTYFNQADCTAAATAKLRIVVGEAEYCANNTMFNLSTTKKCSVAANGDVSSDQYSCLGSTTCASCTLILPTAGRKCRMVSPTEYITDVCSSDGAGATTASSTSAGTTQSGASTTATTTAGSGTNSGTAATTGGSSVDAPAPSAAAGVSMSVATAMLTSAVALCRK